LPIYEYECSECSHKFELRRSFSDDSPVLCPRCECSARRVFSPVPIIFKGSGFYATDNRGNHGHSETPNSSDEAKNNDTRETKTGSPGETKAGKTEDN